MNKMIVLIMEVFLLILLLGLRSLDLSLSNFSLYELKRRAQTRDSESEKALRRARILPDILELQHALHIILLILITLCSLYIFGWAWGTLVSFIAIFIIGLLAQTRFISSFANKLYGRYETHIHHITYDLKPFLHFVPSNLNKKKNDFHLSSKEEAAHLILQAKGILSENEKSLLVNALQFENRLVSEIMKPKNDIKTVKDNEMLGPLVLDRLHKSGHVHFPVIKKDINHVVGLLRLDDGLNQIKLSTTSTAAALMQPKVFYINQADTLPYALAAFLHTGSPLFIVVNEHEKTIGIITLSDVIKALIGRKLQNESDQHEDLSLAAKHSSIPDQISDKNTPVT